VDSGPFVSSFMKYEDGLGSACPAERPLFGGPVSEYGSGRCPEGVSFVENKGLSSQGLRDSSVGSTRLSFVE
jgi:hypothetical protein